MGSHEIANASEYMKLRDYTGACNEMTSEHFVSADGYDFTYEDIMAFQDAYYNGEGLRHIHMSDVTGRICWKSLGELENRKLADRINENCDRVLKGKGAAQKCDALYEAVNAHAKMPLWKKISFSAGAGGLSLLTLLVAFGTRGIKEFFGDVSDIARKLLTKGPKGPGGPQSPGESSSPEASAPPPPPASENDAPAEMVRLPDIEISPDSLLPSRPVWQYPLIGLISGLIVISLVAEEAGVLYQRARARSLVPVGVDGMPGFLSGEGYGNGYSGCGPGA